MDKQGKSDARYRSVAKGVRLIGLRVLDATGAGYTSTVIQAIEFAIANKATLGIDVLNLSLGHPIYQPAATDPLVQAVERAVAAGIVVATSAGQRRHESRDGPGGLRWYHVARQRAVGDYGRRRRHAQHHDTARRPGDKLQLQGSDMVRRVREA